MNYLAELRDVIREVHRCDAAHTRTEFVRHTVEGDVRWEGKVEVFALSGHDNALRCYAWGREQADGSWELTTVLAIPPVVSAATAVTAALVARLKPE